MVEKCDLDKLIFILHGWISNHSQSLGRALIILLLFSSLGSSILFAINYFLYELYCLRELYYVKRFWYYFFDFILPPFSFLAKDFLTTATHYLVYFTFKVINPKIVW